MKKNLLSVVLLPLFMANFMQAQTVWNGPAITFTKPAGANPNLASSQDRITSNTWLTRGSVEGLYNFVYEVGYTRHTSPENTEWATGALADYATLSYTSWYTWAGGNPPTTVGVPAVLHLITENIYIGITFTGWGAGAAAGGSFSYQRTTAPITTPVILTGFTATKKNEKLQLDWTTASEENTAAFEVERSADGKNFKVVGTVAAAGNSSAARSYSFTDAHPLSNNFYRIKMVDHNTSFHYSHIVAFKMGKIKKLDFFPVPAQGSLNIQANVSGQTELQIIDGLGRVRKTRVLADGNNAFALPIDDLQAGIYFLKLAEESRIFMKE